MVLIEQLLVVFKVSTFSKAVDTPFSSVRKSDVRISNPGVALAPAYQGIAAPLVTHYGVAAPLAAPVAKVSIYYNIPVAVTTKEVHSILIRI